MQTLTAKWVKKNCMEKFFFSRAQKHRFYVAPHAATISVESLIPKHTVAHRRPQILFASTQRDPAKLNTKTHSTYDQWSFAYFIVFCFFSLVSVEVFENKFRLNFYSIIGKRCAEWKLPLDSFWLIGFWGVYLRWEQTEFIAGVCDVFHLSSSILSFHSFIHLRINESSIYSRINISTWMHDSTALSMDFVHLNRIACLISLKNWRIEDLIE